MCSRGFLLSGRPFFTDYFLRGPAVEVARLRYPRQEAEALRVHPAAEVADQVCLGGRRALYRRR
jgi:hypothetical protein